MSSVHEPYNDGVGVIVMRHLHRDPAQPGAVPSPRHDEVEPGREPHPHSDVVRRLAHKLRQVDQHPAGLLILFESQLAPCVAGVYGGERLDEERGIGLGHVVDDAGHLVPELRPDL